MTASSSDRTIKHSTLYSIFEYLCGLCLVEGFQPLQLKWERVSIVWFPKGAFERSFCWNTWGLPCGLKPECDLLLIAVGIRWQNSFLSRATSRGGYLNCGVHTCWTSRLGTHMMQPIQRKIFFPFSLCKKGFHTTMLSLSFVSASSFFSTFFFLFFFFLFLRRPLLR